MTSATAFTTLRFCTPSESKYEILNGCNSVRVSVLLSISDLVVSAQRIQGPESFIIEIEASKVAGLLNEFDNEFAFMAQFLKLQDKRMVLINPVSRLQSP